MDVFEYIELFKDKDFEEEPLNEIDYTIFATLSYVDFDNILYRDDRKILMEEAGEHYFEKHSKKDIKNNIIGVVNGIKIFEAIYKTKRYKDLYLYNYSYKSDYSKQFSALFIDLGEFLTYVSFEGTDDLISGWKEDFVMSYEFPVPAQKETMSYINQKIPFLTDRKYIFGGHSKGGNLALVAGMYLNPLKKSKLKAIYSFDGPGLMTKEFRSLRYKSIESKFHLVIPNYSIVGLLLRHTDDYKVIKSTSKSPYCHSVASWVINNNKYEESILSEFSLNVDDSITRWLDLYSTEEMRVFTEDLFDVLDRANIKSLLDIKASTVNSVYKILKESKNIEPETKEKINQLLSFLKEYVKIYLKEKMPFFGSKKNMDI